MKNREIKFKFWDTKSNTMYPAFTLAEIWSTVEVNESLITLQYTGLKDKNGVEIYEGDIVLINDKFQVKIVFGIHSIGMDDWVYPTLHHVFVENLMTVADILDLT